jgi:predicted PurR-regulated permease PerM
MSKQQMEISIAKSTLWRIVFLFIGFAAVVKLQSLIFYLLFALLFAVAVAPLVSWFQSKGLKHSSALALALVMMVGGIFTMAGVVAVSLIDTVSTFVNDLPIYIESLRQYSLTEDYVDGLLEAYDNIDVGAVVQSGLSTGSSLLSGVSKMFEAVLFTFFFTVYMLLERDYLLRVVRSLIPKTWKPRMKDLEREFVEVVGSYIRGQLLTSFLMGLASYIIFRALGIPNALALGIIAGLTDIIPVVGGLIGLIPAVLVAITVSPTVAILCIVLVQTYSTQAIHNELIKDKRFVLIGRGIYALKEWGYTQGTVADVIANVLRKEGGPLHRDEIVKRVLKSRQVKETTILLNLQGKAQFKRVAKATYELDESAA